MFGTDLPSVRARRAFSPDDTALVEHVLGAAAAQAVLHDNADCTPARLARLQAARTRGVRAGLRPAVACVTPTGAAARPPAGAHANTALTYCLSGVTGADSRASRLGLKR